MGTVAKGNANKIREFNRDAYANKNNLSGSPMQMGWAEHKLNDGELYIASDRVTLGSAATRDFLVIVSDTGKVPHLVLFVNTSFQVQVDIYEKTTDTGGTPIDAISKNRNIAIVAETSIAHTPDGAVDGNLIFTTTFGLVDSPIAKNGFEDSAIGHFILKRNTKYIFRITSAAAANIVASEFNWYEETSLV